MSRSARDGKYANSAIIAAVDPGDFKQEAVEDDHPLAGMYFQRRIEEEAYRTGNGCIPVQSFPDFESDHHSDEDRKECGKENRPGSVKDCYTWDEHISGAVMGHMQAADLRGIFSEDIDEAIIESMHRFGHSREGFDTQAVMLGIEARTSSPVRIERNDKLQSNFGGLYPCGEGAGYAGGIMSAASDGIKCAEEIIKTYIPPDQMIQVDGS